MPIITYEEAHAIFLWHFRDRPAALLATRREWALEGGRARWRCRVDLTAGAFPFQSAEFRDADGGGVDVRLGDAPVERVATVEDLVAVLRRVLAVEHE